MKARQYKGFTLMEMVIGFLILSFIVILVSTVMSSGYVISAKLHELPNAYYGAQNEVERRMEELSSLVKEKYRLQNEINNTAPGDLDPSVRLNLAEVNNRLGANSSESVVLFGKTVEIFKIDVDHVSEKDQKLTIHAGVVNAESLNRLVPIIDKVNIQLKNSTVAQDLYFSEGKEVETTVSYNSKNLNYKFKDLYQWYIGTGNYHIAEYSDGLHLENEDRIGTAYTNYPDHYTLLPGETQPTISIKKEYYGQLLVCVVTPLSKNGAMGESKVSNALYISALPEISSGKYRMFVDVSAHPFPYTANPNTDPIKEISNRGLNTVQGKFVAPDDAKPVVNLDGAPTDTTISTAPTIMGTYTRYIKFTSSTYMTSNNFWNNIINPHAFVVVKNNNSSDVDFITVKDQSNSSINIKGGLITNIRKTDGHGDSGWQVIEVKLNGDDGRNLLEGVITLGKTNVDVAEFIVVGNAEATREECDKIWNYLLQKYRIVE